MNATSFLGPRTRLLVEQSAPENISMSYHRVASVRVKMVMVTQYIDCAPCNRLLLREVLDSDMGWANATDIGQCSASLLNAD